MKMKTLSAGAVPVRFKDGEWEYLLLRSFKYWDFPKGMVEEKEDPWLAAIREVQEETGLSKFTTPFGFDFFETQPYGKGKVARYYIIKIEEDKEVTFLPNPITGIVEHHEYRWVKFNKAFKMLVPRVQAVLSWANNMITTRN